MADSIMFAKPPYSVAVESNLQPFKIDVQEEEVNRLKLLLDNSPIPGPNWENTQTDYRFGPTREWLINAAQYWRKTYNWRKWEAEFNSFPQYTIDVRDDDKKIYKIRFSALFSTRSEAIPIILLHGWPGSIVEFIPLLNLVRKKWSSPEDLPYHLIVPDLIGYGFASPPADNYDFGIADNARLVSKLMKSLGFNSQNGGYMVQGGDVGSLIAPALAGLDPAVRLVHVNMLLLPPPPGVDIPADIRDGKYTAEEIKSLGRGAEFQKSGSAYAILQGTRPSTAGIAIGSTPIGLLAWIGEKFLQWSDPQTLPSLEHIVTDVAYYWFSKSYPTSIWVYRSMVKESTDVKSGWDGLTVPTGYSWFRKEIVNPPKPWRDSIKVIKWHREHENGGHFAALEQPHVLWQDIEDFTAEFWPMRSI